MKKVKSDNSDLKRNKLRPGLTPEAREKQLIALAENCAEQQLREGSASSQVIVHYLKLGTERERIEREILEKQKELISAKTNNLQTAMQSEISYEEVIKAMKSYSGQNASYED